MNPKGIDKKNIKRCNLNWMNQKEIEKFGKKRYEELNKESKNTNPYYLIKTIVDTD